jgi:HEPN domain-containing protein
MSEDDPELASDRVAVVRQSMEVAHRDVRAARACLDAQDPVPEVAAYLCQQATEKLIKGLLVLAAIPFRKTHDIETLRDLAVPCFPALVGPIDQLVSVTPWASSYRYPGQAYNEAPSVEDLRAVLDTIRALSDGLAALVSAPNDGSIRDDRSA